MMSRKMKRLSLNKPAVVFSLFAAVLCGCEEKTAPALEEVYPAEGNAYMNDPAFRAQLDSQSKEKDAICKSNFQLNAEFQSLLKSNGGDYAAATNTPRGAELAALIRENQALLVSNRMETARLARERIKRAQEDSRRIRRGEAKAIDISKNKESK